MKRRKLIAGNWKMFGTLAENEARLTSLSAAIPTLEVDWAVFPSLAHLGACQSVLQRLPNGAHVHLGAQTLAAQEGFGAFTGEVSAAMLADFGVRYALIGHSERRSLFGESDAVCLQKFQAATHAGLVPILCVGETLAERDAGATESVIERQLNAIVASVGAEGFGHALIAYEPVWAIGSGRAATKEQAIDVHRFIRTRLGKVSDIMADSVRILYGGSVKPANAKDLFSAEDIDGGLIGGASLNAADFCAIGAAAISA